MAGRARRPRVEVDRADEPALEGSSYWDVSRRPLQILVFLLPLIVAYELGLAWVLRTEGGVITNKAHESLLTALETLGVNAAGGLYLGGIVIVVVLLVWHLLCRDPWTIDWPAIGLMGGESIVLTLPLVALALVLQRAALVGGSADVAAELSRLSLGGLAAISVGAGLYEELVFRMLLIAIAHTLLVDLAGMKAATGTGLAVLLSAVAFMFYHPLRDAAGAVAAPRVAFFFLAGLYFGLVYVWRGFGIVVAVHALYDVVTIAWGDG